MTNYTTKPGVRPGDRVKLTWLDRQGKPTFSDDFKITPEFDPESEHGLSIRSPLGERLACATAGETVTFRHGGEEVTVRIETHNPGGRHDSDNC